MSREIRRVPPNWQHPRKENGGYQPLYDMSFRKKSAEWKDAFNRWESEEDPDKSKYHDLEFWELYGPPPERECCREGDWTRDEATAFQVYETVSEGTPVSPVFGTEEELIEYLVAHGDFWAQKNGEPPPSRKAVKAFLKHGWAPSAIFNGTTLYSGISAMEEVDD